MGKLKKLSAVYWFILGYVVLFFSIGIYGTMTDKKTIFEELREMEKKEIRQ